jgi:AraC-type transcriptional regulator
MTTETRAAAKLAAPTINLASLIYGLDAYLRSRGTDAADALRRAGLEPGDLTDPDRRVPLIRYLELLEICADLLGDPQFGLKFGAHYEPRHAGVVGNIALAARTVGEAFETIGRYLPTMVDATVHGVEVSDGIAFVYSYYIDPLMMSYRQMGDRVRVQPHARRALRSALDPTGGPAAAVGGRNAGGTPHPRGDHGR